MRTQGTLRTVARVAAMAAVLALDARAAGYKMPITFAGYTNRSETLTDFPLLVVLSNNVAGSGFDFQIKPLLSASGWDLRFKTNLSDTGSATLAYEIESIDTASVAYVWVKVPSIPTNGSGRIWATWGDSGDSDQLPCTTNGAVWNSNYRGVWHFPAGATLDGHDSTAYTNHGVNTSMTPVIGPVGGGASGGAGTRLTMPSLPELNGVSAFSMSGWAQSGSGAYAYFGQGSNPGAFDKRVRFYHWGGDGNVYVDVGSGQAQVGSYPTAWRHYAIVYDGSQSGDVARLKVYINGELQSPTYTAGIPATTPACNGPFYVNRNETGADNGNAQYDEIRVATNPSSADWAWAEYQTMASNRTFNAYGTVEALAPPTLTVSTLYATNYTASAADLVGNLATGDVPATVFCYWGTVNGGQTPSAWQHTNSFSVSALGRFTNTVASGLSPETAYYFRFHATNAGAAAWASSHRTFTTLEQFGWLGSYKYRKALPVNAIAGAGTGYQIQVKIGETSGAAGEDLDLEGNSENFPNDIRFTDNNGMTQLGHYLESVSGSAPNRTATFWVKVNDSLESGATIDVYYGLAADTSASDPTNTFNLYDGFDGTSLNTAIWDEGNSGVGSLSFGGGALTVTSSGDWWNAPDGSRFIVSKTAFAFDYAVEARVLTVGSVAHNRFLGLRASTGTSGSMYAMLGDSDRSHITGVWRESVVNWGGEDSGVAYSANQMARIERAGDTVIAYFGGSLANTHTVSGWGLNYPALTSTQGGANQFDWVRVRKYAATATTFGTVGDEESNGMPEVGAGAGATGIGANEAYLTAILVSTGTAETVWGVCWGTTDAGQTTNPAAWTGTGAGTTNLDLPGSLPGTNDVHVTGLASQQSYVYRVWAGNVQGTNWSDAVLFATLGAPTVDNDGGANVTGQTAATLRGMVLGGNPDPEVSIYWGTANGGTNPASWNLPVISLGTRGLGSFSTNMTGLTIGQTYWYRCHVANAYGTNWADASTNFTTAVADGTWASDVDGNWSDSAKWAGGVVAGGADKTAGFIVNPTAPRSVTMDIAGLKIGRLEFSDTIANWSGETWTLTNASNTLILDRGGAGTPSIAFGSQWDFAYSPHVYIDTILGGSAGVEIQPLAGMTYPGRVWFRRANTYSGTTTVRSNGWLNARVPGALGAANAATVNGGGVLVVGVTSANGTNSAAITLESNAILVAQAVSSGQEMTLAGTVSVDGSVTIACAGGDYVVNGGIVNLDCVIAQSAPGASVTFRNYPGTGNKSTLRIRQANQYTGATVLQPGARIYLDHPDGFGTHAETIAVVGADAGNGLSELVLSGAGGELLDGNKALWVGTNATVYQNDNTILTNTVTLAGGTYAGSSYGIGSSTNSGSIVLAAGWTSAVSRVNNNPYDHWYQAGAISGAGALRLTGVNGNDGHAHFNGSNTYSGGTWIDVFNAAYNHVGGDQALGTGPVALLGATTNDVLFQLDRNVTLPNAFTGVGRIQTGAYTLTAPGSFAPGSNGTPIATIAVDSLQFGATGRGGTYNWQFTNGANDTVACGSLTFAPGAHTLNCEWLGAGPAPTNTYVLFTYTGADPSLVGVGWNITGLESYSTAVSVDAAGNRVLLTVAAYAGEPSIENVGTQNVTQVSADLVGNLTGGSVPATVKCFWGTSDGLDQAANWGHTNTFAVAALGAVTNAVNTLAGGTPYYFRYYATNGGGEAWALSSVSFMTPGAPWADNGPGATNVGTTTATLQGRVLGGSPNPHVWIYWGTSNGYTAAADWDRPVLDLGARGLGGFATNLTGLTPAQTYWYRCFVSNVHGAAWAPASTNFIAASLGINGTWLADASGNWSDPGKWVGGIIATGPNYTAAFTVNVTALRLVTMDVSGLTIGHLKFGDDTFSWNNDGWTLTNTAGVLTLDTGGAGTPSIACGGMGNPYVYANVDAVLGGSEGLEAKMTAGMNYVGKLFLRAANVYSGTTTVRTNACLVLKHAGALGAGNAVTVENGGVLLVGNNSASGAIATNGAVITLGNGATLAPYQQLGGGPTMVLTGAVALSGAVDIRGAGGDGVVQYESLVLDTVLTETTPGASVRYGNYPQVAAYRGSVRLAQANAYSGGSTLLPGCVLYLGHADGLGTNAETIAFSGIDDTWGVAELTLSATGAAGALNAHKSLWVGTNAIVYQGMSTLVSNAITLAGGSYRFTRENGSCTNSGAFSLATGTTSILNRAWSGEYDWYQLGSIGGSGAIRVTGGSYDEVLRLRGDNTYSGGTILENSGTPSRTVVGADHAFGTGPVALQGASGSDVMFALEQSVTMPNAFTGVGRINTGAHTLTATGSFAPGLAGTGVGTLTVDNLRLGAAGDGCVYNWQFTNGANDAVACGSLTFAQGTQTLNCGWLGAGAAPPGTNTLFAYTGADPDMTGVNWLVSAPAGLDGRVELDSAGDRVVVVFETSYRGTVFTFR